jgi:hypothetical protein
MRHATDPLASTSSDVVDPPAPGIARTDAVGQPRRSTVGAVAEAPRDFRLTYSLRDIHRLSFLTADERQAVCTEWKAWHRRHASIGALGVAAWAAGAAVAWACSFGAEGTAASIAALAGWHVPLGALYAAAGLLAVGLLVATPLVFSTLASAALCDAFVAGYADGMVVGVNRSLQITPEREQEMWGELHAAEARDLRAAIGAESAVSRSETRGQAPATLQPSNSTQTTFRR